MLFFAFFGIVLTEHPEIIAWPLLHFSHSPANIPMSAVALIVWHAAIWCWISIHRNGIRGGSLWKYSQCFPTSEHERRSVDTAILSLCLAGFWAVSIYAAYKTYSSSSPYGTDGNFWLYFSGIAFLTGAFSKIVTYESGNKSLVFHSLASIGLIVSPAMADRCEYLLVVVVAFFSFIYCSLKTENNSRKLSTKNILPIKIDFKRHYTLLFFIQLKILAENAHAVIPRVATSFFTIILLFWLATLPNRTTNEQVVFLHISLATTCALMSGLYSVLYRARLGIEPWLGTIPLGRFRWKLVEEISVCGFLLSIFLVLSSLYAHQQVFPWNYLLYTCLLYFMTMPLLGATKITRSHNSIILKFFILTSSLFIIMEIS